MNFSEVVEQDFLNKNIYDFIHTENTVVIFRLNQSVTSIQKKPTFLIIRKIILYPVSIGSFLKFNTYLYMTSEVLSRAIEQLMKYFIIYLTIHYCV